MSAPTPTTWHTFDTEYSACSVESCVSSTVGPLVVTGTYQVTKVGGEGEEGDSPRTERLGRIYLHTVSIAEEGGRLECSELARLDCPAVLDMKWSGEKDGDLAVVDSVGCCTIYRLGSSNTLNNVAGCVVSEGLALAVDWNITGDTLAVSDSKGVVHTVKYAESSLSVDLSIPGHEFEAWTTCFSKDDSNLLFSGGDDCSFNLYDLRLDITRPVRKNSKSHTMGVTTMLASQTGNHEVWTGSYDEQVRAWDVRSIKSPLWDLRVGGGVWRVRQKGDTLLVGAMHGGFCLVQDQKVVLEYKEHESLAYGADWVRGLDLRVGGETLDTIATCSFYDHLLKVWSVPRDLI